jgi:uncharacterized membrane protein YjjP (DUF1212 family)
VSTERDIKPANAVEVTMHSSIDRHRLDRVARILKKIVDHARATKEGQRP